MKIRVAPHPMSWADLPIVIVPVFEGDTGAGVAPPEIVEARQRARFAGARHERMLVAGHRGDPFQAVLLVGLGAQTSADPSTLRAVTASAIEDLHRFETAAIALPGGLGTVTHTATAAAEGALLGSYSYPRARPGYVEAVGVRDLHLLVAEEELTAAREAVRIAEIISASVNWVRELVDAPAAELTPTEMALRTIRLAEQSGMEVTVHDVATLRAGGFGGVLAVGQGSNNPPCMITARHAGTNGRTVALVGKGITFDSGGLMLKARREMGDMRTDMAGGAAVLAAVAAASRLSCPTGVVAIVPAAENMPSGNAYRPGDVIRHYGGLTSEVIDTDAEGRIVLADALAYVTAEHGPEVVIDVATLTYDVVHALGDEIGGILGTDDSLISELISAGTRVGEPLWQLPLWRGYRRNIDSRIADVRNEGCSDADAIHAALFLAEFTRGVPWAHLDIAGTAYIPPGHPDRKEGATGTTVRTLVDWLHHRV